MSQHFDLDPMQVEERTGWKVTRKAQPALPAGGAFRALPAPAAHRADPTPTADPADVEAAAEALMDDLAPVRDLLGQALEDCGGDLKAAVAQVATGIPGLAEKMAGGKLEEVLESATAQAMASVLEAEAAKGRQNGREGKGA